MTNKEQAYEIIKILVDKFEQGIATYKNNNYNETETRNEFIDPFWKALGWDLENKAKLSPVYKEVVVEKTQKVGSDYYRPDYNFRNSSNGKILFYFEAKKPFVNLKNDLAPALQARRYGYQNNSVNISILANFEEFAIYNCRKKTRANDTAKTARLEFLTYKDYVTRFDFIWEVFAKENAQNGSIETYADKFKEIRESKDSIDADFLNSLETWRKFLATDIAQKNPNLEEFQLNFTVQQTIDRIVFLKIAEDREIEPEKKLFNAAKKGNIYDNIFDLFITADQRYNSGLFNFKKDVVSRNIKIDNKILRAIIKELYEGSEEEGHNGIGYRFDIIPVEILGYAYEQFLGNVIRIDANGSAIIEPKPEVRKAGGVFYTPVEVVNYIVENTIGEKIKEISPPTPEGGVNTSKIPPSGVRGLDIIAEIAKLKIIDPACGSGSFLLGAYDFLLKWHLDFYTKNPKAPLPKSPSQPSPKGELTTPSPLGRAGVGLALTPIGTLTSAVKKQILLNNIFGVDIDEQAVEVTKLSLLIKCLEGETEATVAEQLINDKVLPTLDNNILCGNSLINHDFYEGGLFPTAKEMRKINTFDWKQGFAEVFKAGGFDCVIGNPPYGAAFPDNQKKYLRFNFQYSDIETESYLLFIEKAMSLMVNNAISGVIIPSNLFTNIRYDKIRKLLLNQTQIKKLADLGANIFKQAAVDTCILNFSKGYIANNITKTFVGTLSKNMSYNDFLQDDFLKNTGEIFNIYVSKQEKNVENKISANNELLKNLVKFARGVEFGYSSKYITNKVKKNAKPILAGRCIARYGLRFEGKYVLYDEKDLSNFKDKSIYENEKLLIRRIGHEIIAAYDNQKYYNVCDVYNILSFGKINLKYILGILNSSLMSFYMNVRFKNSKKLFPKIPIAYLEQLPIKILNTSNKLEQQQHDKLVLLVEKMLDLQQKTALAKIPQEKTMYERLLQTTDNQINSLVYELYELTNEEIEVIENQK